MLRAGENAEGGCPSTDAIEPPASRASSQSVPCATFAGGMGAQLREMSTLPTELAVHNNVLTQGGRGGRSSVRSLLLLLRTGLWGNCSGVREHQLVYLGFGILACTTAHMRLGMGSDFQCWS